MKKLLSLALVFVFIVGLVGCTKNEPTISHPSFEETMSNHSAHSTSTTSITQSFTADTSTTSTPAESESTQRETVATTARRYDDVLSEKTIKSTYILSTKYPNDLNNHCIVRTLSEQENALLTNLFNAPNVTFREERDGWAKFIPSRPNEYAMAIDFTDDTCMILAIHFNENNSYTYYIATAMTNDKYDQETDYKELEFKRYIANSEFGEYLRDIIFNYTTTTTQRLTTTATTGSELPSRTTTTTARATQTTVPTAPQLPDVKFSFKDSRVHFRDMEKLPSGGYVVCGGRYTENSQYPIIQLYDEDSNFLNEYAYQSGMEFTNITVCSDDGLLATSYNPPCVTKINSAFKEEWFKPYENIEFWGGVYDIEEISPDFIAVSFVSVNSPDISRRRKISFLNKQGELLETVDFTEDVDISQSQIIADGNGGFYFLSSCNKELADKYKLVAESYDYSKSVEVIAMHFSANRELTWVKTLGGGGDDWMEEGFIDENGDLYLAVATQWNGNDSFWEMSVDRSAYIRRMLVKVDKKGNIIYKTPLSYRAMGSDQVFGILIDDDRVLVIGMSDYFDGYQEKYPCEQILPSDKLLDERIFCVYNVCLDTDGKELNRRIFRCDINNMPCDSVLLPNGSMVIAGSVSSVENPFLLDFLPGIDYAAALFIYK